MNHIYKDMHIKNIGYGATGARYTDRIIAHINKYKPESILDFGCGKGKLLNSLKTHCIDIDEYDPAIIGKDKISKYQYDLIITTDVLEHLYEDEIQAICNEFMALSPQTMFHVICTRIAGNLLPDGSNAHKTVKNIEWWADMLVLYTGYNIEIIKNPIDLDGQTSIIILMK